MLKRGKKRLKNKIPINRHCSKPFSFIRAVKLKKTHCMKFLILENQIQDLISPNCGQFQLYSYKNLFDPDEKSKILSHGTLSNSTLETITNEIFSTDLDKNEHIVKSCRQEYEL